MARPGEQREVVGSEIVLFEADPLIGAQQEHEADHPGGDRAMLGESLVGLLDEQPRIPAELGSGEAAAELTRAQLLITLVVTDKLRCLDVDVVEPRLEDGAGVGTGCLVAQTGLSCAKVLPVNDSDLPLRMLRFAMNRGRDGDPGTCPVTIY